MIRKLIVWTLILAIALTAVGPAMAQRGDVPAEPGPPADVVLPEQARSGQDEGDVPAEPGPPADVVLPEQATRDQEGDGSQVELAAEEEETQTPPPGLAQRMWAWSLGRGMTLARRVGVGVTPFMFYGTAEIDDGALIVDAQQGNRWALEGLAADAELDTEDAIISAVYEDEELESALVEWEDLEAILEDCPEATVQVFGFMSEDEDGNPVFKAYRITVRVPETCTVQEIIEA